jgi:hypothetical protein
VGGATRPSQFFPIAFLMAFLIAFRFEMLNRNDQR